MFSLILAIFFGLGLTYFAFQNSVGVPVSFANYDLPAIPLYLIVTLAVLAGILMAWFISAVDGMSTYMRIRQKDSVINNDKKEINSLQEKIHLLEKENTSLKGNNSNILHDREGEATKENGDLRKPSIFQRLFPSSTRRYSKI